MRNQKQKLIHIYTGNGKGKTTTAIGLAVRAAGHGIKTIVFQFLKYGNFQYGEEKTLSRVKNIKFVNFKQKSPFFDKNLNILLLKKQVENDMKKAFSAVNSGRYGLVVLDEVTYILNYRLFDEKKFIKKITAKSVKADIVLTGRHASKALIKAAGLVTEMKEIKHPFNKGLKARKGVEF